MVIGQAELTARAGLKDRLDIGVKAWLPGVVGLPGALIDLKYQVVRTRFFDFAVSPGLGFSPDLSFIFLSSGVSPPAIRLGGQLLGLLGFNAGEWVSLILSPKVGAAWGLGQLEVFAGSGVGFCIRVTPKVWLMPEVSGVVNLRDNGPVAQRLYLFGALGVMVKL